MNNRSAPENNNNVPKILYVDDEGKALKYFSMAFGQTYPILTATSVAEALVILAEHSAEIGVLVTDQRMPGETGVELLDHVRHEYPHMIRILTTAYAELDDAIAAVNRGEIFRYVTKPWNIESLGTELAQAMEFFNLRLERDLLLEEKLSVHRRQSQLNRARDLIVMAATLPVLRHTQQAVYAYLSHFIRDLDISHSDDAHWRSEEHEIQRSMAIATMVGALAERCSGHFDHSDSASALLKDFSQLDMSGLSNVVQLNTDQQLIKKMLLNIISALGGDNAPLSVEIKATDDVCIELSCKGSLRSGNEDLDAWLEAYLIAYHHAGCITIESDNEHVRCSICLPKDPANTRLPRADAFRMDEIFSQLEDVD